MENKQVESKKLYIATIIILSIAVIVAVVVGCLVKPKESKKKEKTTETIQATEFKYNSQSGVCEIEHINGNSITLTGFTLTIETTATTSTITLDSETSKLVIELVEKE